MKKVAALFLLLLALSACDIRDNVIEPGISFTRIYDHPDFSGDIHPLSVMPLSDSGYLVLAAKDSWQVYLLKTDFNGNPLWEMTLPSPYVNPLAGILEQNNHFYIACMDEVTLGTYLLEIDTEGQMPSIAASFADITYPLAFSGSNSGHVLLLGYDRSARSSIFAKINPGLSLEWKRNFDVLEDKEELLIKHLTRSGQRLPFFTGQLADAPVYYFNGFVNFTLSTAFITSSEGSLTGNIQGYRNEGYLNALHPAEAGRFALARASFGDNFLLPAIDVNTRDFSFSGDLEARSFPEIAAYAEVVIREKKLAGKDVLLFGSHSKSKQLLLYAYHKEDGTLLGIEHIGQSNPYEIGDFQFTQDGGLILLSKTYVAKRFPRLTLFKLSAQEVEKILR